LSLFELGFGYIGSPQLSSIVAHSCQKVNSILYRCAAGVESDKAAEKAFLEEPMFFKKCFFGGVWEKIR